MRTGRRVALLAMTIACSGLMPARAVAGPIAAHAAAKPSPGRRLLDGWRKTSFRASVGLRRGLVGVVGVGGDVELVVRSKADAEAKGARRAALLLTSGVSSAVGSLRVHGTPDRALIPKRGTWSYSIGPRSKRSPTQGDAILVPTFNPFFGMFVSRMGGISVTFSGLPTPLGGWPFVYGSITLSVDHPALKPASTWILDRVDRFEGWMERKTRWIREPVKRLVQRARQRPPMTHEEAALRRQQPPLMPWPLRVYAVPGMIR